jgi:hypothetical protein
MPSTVSPKFLSDLYGAADISHSPIVMPIVPGTQLVLMGSIMVHNDPAATPTPDLRLRIIQAVAEIPDIFGTLLETIDAGGVGATEPVNASVDRKGAFRSDQLEVGANAPAGLVNQCRDRFRELGIFLEGIAA